MPIAEGDLFLFFPNKFSSVFVILVTSNLPLISDFSGGLIQ
jgi:hypothetical protein